MPHWWRILARAAARYQPRPRRVLVQDLAQDLVQDLAQEREPGRCRRRVSCQGLDRSRAAGWAHDRGVSAREVRAAGHPPSGARPAGRWLRTTSACQHWALHRISARIGEFPHRGIHEPWREGPGRATHNCKPSHDSARRSWSAEAVERQKHRKTLGKTASVGGARSLLRSPGWRVSPGRQRFFSSTAIRRYVL